MDLARLINQTKPLTVSFLGEEVVLEYYTAGYARLTAEQRAPFSPLLNSKNGDGVSYQNIVQAARLALPLIIKSWDVTWAGQPLPIENINDVDEQGVRLYDLPDAFLVEIDSAVRQATVDPSTANESPTSLAQEETVLAQTAIQ